MTTHTFAAGDRVRLNDTAAHPDKDKRNAANNLGTVKYGYSIGGKPVYNVKLDNGQGNWTMYASELDPVIPRPTFKPGDYIRITNQHMADYWDGPLEVIKVSKVGAGYDVVYAVHPIHGQGAFRSTFVELTEAPAAEPVEETVLSTAELHALKLERVNQAKAANLIAMAAHLQARYQLHMSPRISRTIDDLETKALSYLDIDQEV